MGSLNKGKRTFQVEATAGILEREKKTRKAKTDCRIHAHGVCNVCSMKYLDGIESFVNLALMLLSVSSQSMDS